MKILLVSVGMLLLLACGLRSNQKSEQDNPASKDAWTLVWHDEFDTAGLPDSTKWSYDTLWNDKGWGNNEAQFYTANRKENAHVENGFLKITALKEKMGGKEYTSARLISKHKGDWLYGRFEIRAKLPTGVGTWPAIWMLPTDSEYGGWPRSGEIDIMENVGYDPDTIVASAHTLKYNHMIGTQISSRVECKTSYTNFHVYALEWEKDEYRIYLDDIHYYTFKNDGTGFEAWPFDKQFHLLLNLAIGGNWGGYKGIDDTKFPHVMEVDYVRVYRKN